jgi:hypothetical protein
MAHALTASAATLYVRQSNPGPAPPFTTWASAATNIQDAIDAAAPGDDIVVDDGVYGTGGRAIWNTDPGVNAHWESNRVVVTKPLTLRSRNGAERTIIKGYNDNPGLPQGDGVRCVYLIDGAALIGFTLTNGGTGHWGGGVHGATINTFVTDCILTRNEANSDGGGAFRTTLRRCQLIGNLAGDEGGGAANCVLTDCAIANNSASDGGGAYLSVLSSCLVSSNIAYSSGGGALDSTLISCGISNNFAGSGGGVFECFLEYSVVSNNRASGDAGGAHGGSLSNCLLQNNFAGDDGGGAASSTLLNCVITGNSADAGGGAAGGTLDNCTLAGNSADGGGGAAYAALNDCRLISNSAGDGGGAFQCLLNNCVLERNSASEAGGGDGGGAFECSLTNCTFTANIANGDGGGAAFSTLERCKLFENSADLGGGGTVGGTLNNCLLTGNSAASGGGAFLGGLNNCTLTGNSASLGGGAKDAYLVNCIAYFNTASSDPNYSSGVAGNVHFSCTTPLPAGGTSNITNVPAFVNAAAGDYRLSYGSPCIDAGTDLSAVITSDLAGYPRPRDGNGDSVAAFDMGAYEFKLPLLVWPGSPNPVSPFLTWATSAHTIQDAVDSAEAGDEIVVTNGIYIAGGAWSDIAQSSNRVVLNKPVTVRSINGPAVTTIVGAAGATPFGVGAMRCVTLGSGAVLNGFTLWSGFADEGGGAICYSEEAILTNCIIEGNSAKYDGGGVSGGKLYRCVLRDNDSWFGDGGGASEAELHECLVTDNDCYRTGAGVSESTLYNCVITRNHADGEGGGASFSTLYHCTVAANRDDNREDNGCCTGGAIYSTFYNSIAVDGLYDCRASFSWVPNIGRLLDNGGGNIDSPPPMFVGAASGDYRLRPGSPCIDTGTNLSALVSFDFNGFPRPLDGNRDGVAGSDMGAYEFNPLFFTSITSVGNITRVCWFDSLTGMQLQAAPSLSNPVWTNVPFAAGTNCVELPLGNGRGFFRLVQPGPVNQ